MVSQQVHKRHSEEHLQDFHHAAFRSVMAACEADLLRLEERLQEFNKKHDEAEQVGAGRACGRGGRGQARGGALMHLVFTTPPFSLYPPLVSHAAPACRSPSCPLPMFTYYATVPLSSPHAPACLQSRTDIKTHVAPQAKVEANREREQSETDFAYTIAAARRSEQRRLLNYIRMNDYLICDTLHTVLLESVREVLVATQPKQVCRAWGEGRDGGGGLEMSGEARWGERVRNVGGDGDWSGEARLGWGGGRHQQSCSLPLPPPIYIVIVI